MPRPFVCYLRVYEPLSAFDAPLADRLRERLNSQPLSRSVVGEREQWLWLRSQLSSPVRLLPGELPDGQAAPNAPLDVLVLQPEDVPTGDTATVGPGPLVCPLDLRSRAAAALVGFLATTGAVLHRAVLPTDADEARGHATEVMAAAGAAAVHVVSSTWTVPLPWFALVDPDERHVRVGDGDDPTRDVYWRCAMADARRRIARAYSVARGTLGEEGPVLVLRDTGRWLEQFHPHSAVELDYGGLVELMDDDQLRADSSAADVRAIVAAMESGDAAELAVRFQRVREFWGRLAARERAN